MSDLAHFLAQQQVLTGMVGAALAGGLVFTLRQLPGHIAWWVHERVSVSLLIDSDDEAYAWLNGWLSKHRAAKTARRLMLDQAYDYDDNRWRWNLTLGQGWHLLRFRRAWVLIHRHIQEAGDLGKLMGNAKRQRLTVTTLGRSQEPLREIVEEARVAYQGDDRVGVYYWHQGAYHHADKRTKRPIASVYLPQVQKDRLIRSLTDFVSQRDLYRQRGVPHRLGVLLEGPPGTGKTTLIYTLAGLLGCHVYVVNPSQVTGDNDLLAAFNSVGPNAFIALEDIDTVKISRQRRDGPGEPETIADALMQKDKPGVTLSGLLNAIDGVAAREGRILFLTSNHAGQLDPALVRPGRVDVRETIGFMEADTAWQMFQAFRPDSDRGEFEAMVAGRLPMAAADLQNLLLSPDAPETKEAA